MAGTDIFDIPGERGRPDRLIGLPTLY